MVGGISLSTPAGMRCEPFRQKNGDGIVLYGQNCSKIRSSHNGSITTDFENTTITLSNGNPESKKIEKGSSITTPIPPQSGLYGNTNLPSGQGKENRACLPIKIGSGTISAYGRGETCSSTELLNVNKLRVTYSNITTHFDVRHDVVGTTITTGYVTTNTIKYDNSQGKDQY